jgi:CheY-like chemotaxis protein
VNLAVNARDAMPRGGRLTIAVRPVSPDEPDRPDLGAGGLVALTVADTGDGMDARTLPRVFEPFFTTKPPGKGTGLGLSTVYGIVAQGGGTVRVRSAPGEGTTFTVYLPRSRDEEAAPAPAPARARGGGGRVLLVEDDDVLRAIERRALAAAGYRVTDAARPSDALALARGAAFDLLVTDVILPELSGSELAARVLADQPAMRVLYTSGYTDRRLTAEELRAPGVAFLAKPFTPDVLLARVGDILEATERRATG